MLGHFQGIPSVLSAHGSILLAAPTLVLLLFFFIKHILSEIAARGVQSLFLLDDFNTSRMAHTSVNVPFDPQKCGLSPRQIFKLRLGLR